MDKRALLIIDMLNDFVREGAPLWVPKTREVIPVIQGEIKRAREMNYPVIYICDAHDPTDREFKQFGWPAHAVKGTEGANIIDELKPGDTDLIIEKTTYSGFYQTELENVLKNLNIETVRLTGCVTHICVMLIAFEAAFRGYRIEALGDGVAGLAPEDHDAALRFMKNVLCAQII